VTGEVSVMMLKSVLRIFAGAALGLPLLASAQDFDGSKPFICAVTEVFECYEHEGCSSETTEATLAPEFLKFDIKKKTVVALTDAEPRTSKMQYGGLEGDVLVIQGIENFRGWTVTIVTMTGEMSASVAGEKIAFVLFGNCTYP
jgi:hypothetical protein